MRSNPSTERTCLGVPGHAAHVKRYAPESVLRNTLILFAYLLPISCYSFDVDGFTTNMQKQSVIATAEKGYKLVAIDENTLIANAADGGYLSFNFCEGRLVSVQKGFPANLQQVTLLVSEFKAKYGNPFSTNAGTRAHSSGTIYEWGTWWNAGKEYVSLYYTGSPLAESLSTSYQSKNKCFKVPR